MITARKRPDLQPYSANLGKAPFDPCDHPYTLALAISRHGSARSNQPC
jgi:hypothetical protein